MFCEKKKMSKSASVKSAANGVSTIRLIIPAQKAAPTPPVGPALGQKGIKSMDFCKAFNDRTKTYAPGVPITTIITVQPDRSYKFVTKAPPTTWLLKQAADIKKGSSKPGELNVADLSLKHVYEIACIKQKDPALEGVALEKVAKRIIGTARGMGLNVVP